ncbi:MAG: hypothetical protein JXQ73_03240 [Phycisphaerae bacterium]|nr:hypothetical protein [Phycisphaerae bacterium]
MGSMSQSEFEKWEEVRREGRSRYLSRDGVLYGGTTAFLGECFGDYVKNGSLSGDIGFVVGVAVLTALGALLFAYLIWQHNEKKCREYVEKAEIASTRGPEGAEEGDTRRLEA